MRTIGKVIKVIFLTDMGEDYELELHDPSFTYEQQYNSMRFEMSGVLTEITEKTPASTADFLKIKSVFVGGNSPHKR
jgi:hypothetical protein